jgi:predicted SnoaL-like aldol condensation-catalyzing enzyme
MKKLLFTAAAGMLCFFISCNDSGTTSSTNNSQSEKNKADSKTINNALETGDLSKLDSLIDKDIVDHGDPNGDVKGLDNVKKFFVQFHNSVKDLKIESIANATDGDYNLDLNRTTGTVTAPFMGMPAGTNMDMTIVDVVRIKDGKAVEHWAYSDPRDMMKHMKDMPPMDNKMDNKMNGKMDSSKMKK